MKTKTSLLALTGALAASAVSAYTVDFSSYTDGELVGQDGWVDDTGYFSVSSGVVEQVAEGWAKGVERTFTTSEVGSAFDTNSSIIEYSFTFSSASITAGVYDGLSFSIGGDITDAASTQLDLSVMPNGFLKINDGVLSGNDQYFNGFATEDQWAVDTDVTVTFIVDYGNSTYTATRSDSVTSTRTDYTFVKGTGDAYLVRFDASKQGVTDIQSISISTVPEPSTFAAIAGVFALGVAMIRRRK
jgi:hypothetical protein